jgi:WD40 repeat protein
MKNFRFSKNITQYQLNKKLWWSEATLGQDYILSGSRDESIKVWNVETRECIHTLKGHTGWITILLALPYEHKLFSSSEECSIKYWNILDGKCLQTFWGHTDTIESLLYENGELISCSEDESIKIWNVNTGECKHSLLGHTKSVSCLLKVNYEIISSGSKDCNIRLWYRNTGECLNILKGHTGSIEHLMLISNTSKIVSGSMDKLIKIWDVTKGSCLNTLKGHLSSLTNLLWLESRHILISSSFIGEIYIWPLFKQKYQSLKGHSDRISCLLLLNDRTRLSGSEDNSIKIWDISLLVCLRSLDETWFNWISAIILIRSKLFYISDKSYMKLQEKSLHGSKCREESLDFSEKHLAPITCLTSASKIDATRIRKKKYVF